MLLINGRLNRITEREAGNPGNTWIEKTLVVEDWGRTFFCTVGRDFGDDLPEEGESVTLEVSVRAYPKKDGTAGVGFTALRRAAHVVPVAPAQVPKSA